MKVSLFYLPSVGDRARIERGHAGLDGGLYGQMRSASPSTTFTPRVSSAARRYAGLRLVLPAQHDAIVPD